MKRCCSAEKVPLTGYQSDIWVAESRSIGGPQFNVMICERLAGQVDLTALRACLVRVLARYDAFRLRFGQDEEGVPHVFLDPGITNAWEPAVCHVDLSGEDDPPAAVQDWCEREICRPLDLHVGPLFRAALIVESPVVVHLLVKAHHIIADGWALNTAISQVLSSYLAEIGLFSDSYRGPHAEELSYFEFIRDSSERNYDRQLDREFFRNELAGVEPALFLRTGHGRPSRARHSFVIDEQTVDRMLKASASPLPYLASAFAVCLTRIHRSPEIVLGVPFLNRCTEQERLVVGQFANALPLRVPSGADTSLLSLANQVNVRIGDLKEHEHLPFGEILREMPVQGANERRLFDVTISYLRFPRHPQIPGITGNTTIMAPVHESDALSVIVHAFEGEGVLRVDLDYARDVFDDDLTAEAFADHVQELVWNGLEKREVPVTVLPMLTADEYERVVRGHQGESVPYPLEKTLHQVFMEQAARTPDLTAAIDDAALVGAPRHPSAAEHRAACAAWLRAGRRAGQV